MNCKEYQEIILTDYLDDQVSKENKQKIENHLSSCRECREFAVIAQKSVIEPFKMAERVTPPEAVWENIMEEMTEERSGNQVNWLEGLKKFLAPKPVFAYGALVCIVLIFIMQNSGVKQISHVENINSQTQEVVQKQMNEPQLEIFESIEFLATLFDENNGIEEYGTSIEEYFL